MARIFITWNGSNFSDSITLIHVSTNLISIKTAVCIRRLFRLWIKRPTSPFPNQQLLLCYYSVFLNFHIDLINSTSRILFLICLFFFSFPLIKEPPCRFNVPEVCLPQSTSGLNQHKKIVFISIPGSNFYWEAECEYQPFCFKQNIFSCCCVQEWKYHKVKDETLTGEKDYYKSLKWNYLWPMKR